MHLQAARHYHRVVCDHFFEDTAWWNGNEHWIEIDQVAATSNNHAWNATGVSPGTYNIAGYVYFGGKAIYSHLTQPIYIIA